MSKKVNGDLNYRAAQLRGPKTLDRKARSLDFVITTETPVDMYDYETGRIVPEILLARAMQMPKQVPLLDTHDRYSVNTVLGSVRNGQVEDGQVAGTAIFSSVKEAEEALTKYEEGHLTDFSAGYRVNNVVRVPDGETQEISGRSYDGPVNVVTSWTLKEVSCVPIGADPLAKARAAEHKHKEIRKGEEDMEDKERFEKIETSLASLGDSVKGLADSISKRFEAEDALSKGEKDVEQMRKDAIKAKHLTVENERKRLMEIDKMCERFDIDDDFRQELIESGKSVDEARALIMERIAAREDDSKGISIRVGKEDREKVRGAMADGIMLRAGIGTESIEDKNNPYRGHSLAEMARELLRFNNQPVPSSKEQLFTRALSTDDFDSIMANVANKAMLDGFEKADETYATWVDTTGVLNDYKAHEFSRASEAPGLQAINPEGGEYTYGIMTDTKESVTAADYGIIIPFTRAAMINDDLGALNDIRTKLGEAAARKYGDLVYAVLTGGTTATMGDGTALFHASHSNYVTAGAAPSATTINAGFTAMATQKDLQSLQTLNIRPEYIVAPWALKGTIDALLHSTAPVVVGSNTVNPMPGGIAVYDARLDTANSSGWYLAARKGKTVKLFTLNGQMTPTIESKSPWVNDGMEFKCRISAAAKAMDWRTLYYNDGVT